MEIKSKSQLKRVISTIKGRYPTKEEIDAFVNSSDLPEYIQDSEGRKGRFKRTRRGRSRKGEAR